jgi:hypothetical protein
MLGLTAAAILTHALAWGDVAHAAGRATWATGPQFQQTLAHTVDVFWPDNPLRDSIVGFARAQQVAILIDRRVDPDQKLSLSIKDVPIQTVLQMIADRCGLGVSRLGAVVYLGPPSAAGRLRPVAAAFEQAVRQLPKAAQRKFLQSKAFAWEDLSTPRDLLIRLGQQNGVQIAGLEGMPHDLWAAADLPPLSLVDRLTLVAAQFDLTFKIAADGTRLELAPIPANLPTQPENHAAGFPGPASSKAPTAEKAVNVEWMHIDRLTVRAEPLGPVLRQLAKRLGLELKIDEQAIRQAGISLDQRVSVTVENATVDEVLRELLKPAGLRFHRRQNVVEIRPAE